MECKEKKYEIKPNYKLDWCSVLCLYFEKFMILPIVKDIENHVRF